MGLYDTGMFRHVALYNVPDNFAEQIRAPNGESEAVKIRYAVYPEQYRFAMQNKREAVRFRKAASTLRG